MLIVARVIDELFRGVARSKNNMWHFYSFIIGYRQQICPSWRPLVDLRYFVQLNIQKYLIFPTTKEDRRNIGD